MYPIFGSYYKEQIKGDVSTIDMGTDNTDSDNTDNNDAKNKLIDHCDPIVYNSDLENFLDIEALSLSPDAVAIPCGQLPRYYPTDRFTFVENVATGSATQIFRVGVWDRNQRYNFTSSDPSDNWWLNMVDHRFPVWMKYRSTMKTLKQWGIIYNDLPAGDYFLYIDISYDSTLFNGEKWVIVSGNTNSYSTRNYGIIVLLGIFFLAMVVIYILLLRVWLKYHTSKSK